MLDRYVDHRGGAKWWRRWAGPAAVLSVVVHVGALVALLIAATWRIEKLEIQNRPVFLALGVGAALPQASEEPRQVAKPKEAPRRVRRVRDLAQPEPRPADPPPDQPAEPDESELAKRDGEGLRLFGDCDSGVGCTPSGLAAFELDLPVCGNGRVEKGEQCDDGGRVNRDGCSVHCALERETMVDNRVIEGYRIAGDPQIHAPDAVRQQMADRGVTTTLGAVKMCLREDGGVLSLRLLRSTGYPAYDRLLTTSMAGWRYRPYQMANGTHVMACTVVTFIYRMNIRRIAVQRVR